MANFSITARQSDIAKWYKDRAAQQANYNTWNDLVKAYTQQATSAFEESTQSAQQSAAYDISQAYANYKQQQIAASLNQNISAGAKDVIGSQLSSAYDISAAQSQYNLAANLQSIYDKYYKTVSTADETLADQFGITDSQIKNTSKGLQYLNKYISESNEYQQLWDNFRKLYKSDAAADEAMQSALFKTTGEGAETTTGLSDLGKNVLASLIHRGATFGEDENRQAYGDIYDYLYKTNLDAYNTFAETPGFLDELLEINNITDKSLQSPLNEKTSEALATTYWYDNSAVKNWYDTNADKYGIKRLTADQYLDIRSSKSGQAIGSRLIQSKYSDIPDDSAFVGDLDLSKNAKLGSSLNGLLPYGDAGFGYTDKSGNDVYQVSLTSDKKRNATIARLKQLGATIDSDNTKLIYFHWDNNKIKNIAMYKDSKGNYYYYTRQPKKED